MWGLMTLAVVLEGVCPLNGEARTATHCISSAAFENDRDKSPKRLVIRVFELFIPALKVSVWTFNSSWFHFIITVAKKKKNGKYFAILTSKWK